MDKVYRVRMTNGDPALNQVIVDMMPLTSTQAQVLVAALTQVIEAGFVLAGVVTLFPMPAGATAEQTGEQ